MKAGNFEVVGRYFGDTPDTGDVLWISSRKFDDDRGYFYESWSAAAFRALGLPEFVQDNHSRSFGGVLRGLHWQGPPTPQGKLIRCTTGRIFDVIVDIRGGSPTFGHALRLDLAATLTKREDPMSDDPNLLYVPPGFAHGFLALTEVAEVQYRVTAPWDRSAEGTLAWNDPELTWDLGGWPAGVVPELSDKDRAGASLASIRENPPFLYSATRGRP